MHKKIELLSPAGSFENVLAAVNHGCDAVYLGGKRFSARALANNFSDSEIFQAIDYCHLRGVKVYITVNTLFKNAELQKVYRFVQTVYNAGCDAVILQDIGMAHSIKKNFSRLKLHASTQMTAHSLEDVLFLQKAGFDRVVLSRELSLAEIEYIGSHTNCEIEIFIHGALCVCYSGQCLMSSMLGGRSGNRGACAQPCRQLYQLYVNDKKISSSYVLSPKDMETVSILRELKNLPVAAFKVEGRMKNAAYTAAVTKVYRKYLDRDLPAVDPQDMKTLLKAFNRGGFSNGYYKTFAGASMMSLENPKNRGLYIGDVLSYDVAKQTMRFKTQEDLRCGDGIEVEKANAGAFVTKAFSDGEIASLSIKGDIKSGNKIYKTYDKKLNDDVKRKGNERRLPIKAYVEAKISKPFYIKFYTDDFFAEAYGDIIEKSLNSETSVDKIASQIKKTGNTPFAIENLEIVKDDFIFTGVSQINQLRRDALEALAQTICQSYRREASLPPITIQRQTLQSNKKIAVHVQNKKQFDTVSVFDIDKIYLETYQGIENDLSDLKKKAANAKLFIALPRIFRQNSIEKYRPLLDILEKSNIDGYLVKTYSQLAILKDTSKKISIDYNMNITNSLSEQFYEKYDSYCVSPELTLKEIKQFGPLGELIIYGRIPVMVTHQCPIRGRGFHKKDAVYIKDKLGYTFPILFDCTHCVATILNSVPLFLLNRLEEIKNTPQTFFRLNFTNENDNEILQIMKNVQETPQEDFIASMLQKGITKGHYYRGVL